MTVLFDLEWTTGGDGTRSMTQLAALRTDAAWMPCAEFHTLVSPAGYDADWDQVAYNGYSPDEFRAAPDEKDALLEFLRWLKKGGRTGFFVRPLFLFSFDRGCGR